MTTATHPTTEHEGPTMTTIDEALPQGADPTTPDHPSQAGRRHPLRAVLRSEVIKATTVRAPKALVAVAVVVGLITSWAIATFAERADLTAVEVFVYPTLLTAVLSAIVGILLFTTEVQHGTLAGALTAHPSRWPVAAAKAIVAAGFGLILGAAGLATGFVGALAGGIEVGDTSGVVTTVLWGLLYTVGAALLGLGVGMAVRHSAAAISGLLVWWLVVEAMVVQFAPVSVVRFVPFDTGFRTLGAPADFDVPEVAAAGLPNVLHASIFWAYVLAALVTGTVLLLRRDPD